MALLLALASLLAAEAAEPEAEALKRFSLSRCQFQELAVPSDATALRKRQLKEQIQIPVRLGNAEDILLLSSHSLRAPNFQLLVQRENGRITSEAPSPSSLWRGSLRAERGGTVTATIRDGCLHATVQRANGSVWTIQPIEDTALRNRRATHVAYQQDDVLPVAWECGTSGGAAAVARNQLPVAPPAPPETASLASFAGFYTAEIAVDADVEFYRLNGSSVSATVADIETVLDAVDAIFARDVGIGYELTTVLVRTEEPDPYSTSDSTDLVFQLSSHWASIPLNVPRDIVHLMTGKDLEGNVVGRAFLGVVCTGGVASGLSQSRFTQNLQQRIALTAHELGHNWGACHCNETACRDQLPGFPGECYIMASQVAANPTLRFGQFERQQIFAHVRDHTNCLAFGNVYVNANAVEPFYGTERNPFRTVADGIRFVTPGGRVLIQGTHQYRENLQISKRLSLEAREGAVSIGD